MCYHIFSYRKHCEAEGIEKIYIPVAGDVIDATTESHIYQVSFTFDVTTSYKLVCRVTLQETALRSAHVMRSQ